MLFVLTASFLFYPLDIRVFFRRFVLQILRFLQAKYWITIFLYSSEHAWIIVITMITKQYVN